MKSKTMKVLHPVGGRSMIGHVLAAVRRWSRSGSSPSSAPSATRSARTSRPAAGLRARRAGDPGRHRPRRADRRGVAGPRPAARSSWSPRRHALARGASLRAFAEEHNAAQRAVSILSGVVPTRSATAAWCATSEGDVEAIVEEKDATAELREIGEINSGILAFDAEFLLEALPQIGNDNAKGEYYLTDTIKLARDAGLTVGAHTIDDVAADRGGQRPGAAGRPGPRAQPPHREPLDEGRRHGDGPRDDVDRGGRRAGAGRHDPARHPAARRDRGRRGRRDRPGHDAEGLRDRRRRPRDPHPGRARRDRRRRDRGPVLLPPPRHQARRRRQDRRVRRDQERPDRRRREGAAPVLRRRRRDRRGRQHRRRHDLRQLRRREEAPHEGRQPGQDGREQHVRGPGGDRRRRDDRRRHDGAPRRTARGPGRVRAPQRNLENWKERRAAPRAGSRHAPAD